MDNMSYIGVPFECGCDRIGTSKAPEWLWRYRVSIVGHTPIWIDMHIFPQDEISCGVKNYDAVLQTCSVLRDTVASEYHKGKNICVIGGDHSIALGSIAGVLENDANVGVLWFDAHGDINSETTSPSANAHGMPVAALMGLCQSELNGIAKTRLKKENIFWVGVRDLDEGEIATIERLGIENNVYGIERVREMGMAVVMEDIKQKMALRGIETIHLSFDIDGMDPSIVWATGTRVENGLMPEDLEAFVKELKGLPEMKSMDFVEYNPLLDDNERTTGKWCGETLMKILKS